jgi:signal transduction histidine kinase
MSKFTIFKFSQHLYVRIYAAVLLSLAVVALVFYGLWRWYPDLGQTPVPQAFEGLSEYVTEMLPPANASTDEMQAGLNHRRWRRYSGMALYTPAGVRLAAAGITLPPPDLNQIYNGYQNGRPPVIQIHMSDGRWLVAERVQPPGNRPPRVNVTVWLGLIALAIGIGAFPVARRMTGRLERLQKSVEALGEGQLSTRVAIEGQDEVARLAASFNRSASRIEALVDAQKKLLANASHELRSPLTRIRMAVELMDAQAPEAMRDELVRNIAELDQLVDEILLASRLDGAGETLPVAEHVDLTALLAEECARVDAQLDAGRIDLIGDSKLLRRMVRNLLENAKRYGDNSPISVIVDSSQAGTLHIDVCDGGRGVPPAEREKIFAPFYRLPGARERDGGVGLGLSLVRQIARAHRGEVVCLPLSERGSCFRVSLPV